MLFNGVEVERFTSAVPTPTDRPTVFFLGRHEQRKGLDVLLEAFERVPEPATLWVAGQGPMTESLRRRYPGSGRIAWLGRLDDGEVAARLVGAHVLCAPSRHGESFGISNTFFFFFFFFFFFGGGGVFFFCVFIR